jgi:hypothetical protein
MVVTPFFHSVRIEDAAACSSPVGAGLPTAADLDRWAEDMGIV